MGAWIASGVLVGIAALHSVLGEQGILRPLFAAEWEVEGIPRWAMERVMRFAWHLTSVAWVCMGAAALGWDALEALAACALVSGGVIFVMLRGHLAWPLFGISGVAALMASGRLGVGGLEPAAWLAAAVAALSACLHVYWALGGTWALAGATPSGEEGAPLFRPGRGITLAVAGALLAFAGLVVAGVSGAGGAWVEWGLWAAVAVLGLRAVGDGKYVGFTKALRGTRFSARDDAIYTPLVTLLAAGAWVAASLAA
jgi:hypothetical protein